MGIEENQLESGWEGRLALALSGAAWKVCAEVHVALISTHPDRCRLVLLEQRSWAALLLLKAKQFPCLIAFIGSCRFLAQERDKKGVGASGMCLRL